MNTDLKNSLVLIRVHLRSSAAITLRASWWSWSGSNRRPPECKSGALPAELQPHFLNCSAPENQRDAAVITYRKHPRPIGREQRETSPTPSQTSSNYLSGEQKRIVILCDPWTGTAAAYFQ